MEFSDLPGCCYDFLKYKAFIGNKKVRAIDVEATHKKILALNCA